MQLKNLETTQYSMSFNVLIIHQTSREVDSARVQKWLIEYA